MSTSSARAIADANDAGQQRSPTGRHFSSPYSAERAPAARSISTPPVEIGPRSGHHARASPCWPRAASTDPTTRAAGTYVELYSGHRTTEGSRAEFAISGKVTVLTVERREPRRRSSSTRCARPSVYAETELLPAGQAPMTRRSAATGIRSTSRPTARCRGPAPDRHAARATTTGSRSCMQATLVAEHRRRAARCSTIAPPLPTPLGASVVVYANVALATHGETVTKMLGARQRQQRSSASSSSGCR